MNESQRKYNERQMEKLPTALDAFDDLWSSQVTEFIDALMSGPDRLDVITWLRANGWTVEPK